MSDETNADLKKMVADLGLVMESEFVPFSQSRNKDDKHPSLNWKVTIKRMAKIDGEYKPGSERVILTTDYMAGCAHTAAYKASIKVLGNRDSVDRQAAIDAECERGAAFSRFWMGNVLTDGAAHEPDILDVLYSLVSDSDVLDHSTFEDWANEFGYGADSRKAESIYRACLEIALKLRNGLGETELTKLRDAFQGY